MGETWSRAVVPLREPRDEVWAGENHREHHAVPRSGGLLHGRRAPRKCCLGTLAVTRLLDTTFDLSSLSSQGFGVAAKSTQECRRVDPMSIVVFHQADVGEFIRNEDSLT